MKSRFSKIRISALILGLTWMSWAVAQNAGIGDQLPSADSILDRYIEVTGGAEAYERKTSEIMRGTMEIRAAGLAGQLEIQTRPGLQYTRIELPQVGVVESGVIDGIAWESNPIAGPRILAGSEAELSVRSAQPTGPLHLKEQFSEIETVGIEEVGGEPAYRVQLTGDAIAMTNFYSVDSGLLLKMQTTVDTPLGAIPVEQMVDEYSDFGGVLTPSRLSVNQAGSLVVITLNSAEANVDIPDERFDPPEAVQALLE